VIARLSVLWIALSLGAIGRGQTAPKPVIPPVAPSSSTTLGDEETWVRRDHQAVIAGKNYEYTTTCGLIPIRNSAGVVEGDIFFSEYQLKGAGSGKRPVTFVFNGGPGSASLWLHLGLVGPKRVKMQSDGLMPPPPYELVPNNESLLPSTDIVCIDPVGTGFSRPVKPEDGPKFWGVQEDIRSVGEFIRSFLTLEDRWLSPLFVMGESYGGIRGSGLALWLNQYGVGLNGLILISPYMNGSVQDGGKANEQTNAFYMPTYSAAAWYHHRLSPDLEKMSVGDLVKKVQNWVYDEYLPALSRGQSLSPEKHKQILRQLEEYTGMSLTFLEETNLRINSNDYFKELLRDKRYTVGRYDARFKGLDRAWNTQGPDYDPSDSEIMPPFTSCMNEYVRQELGYKTDLRYFVLGEGLTGPWKMGDGPVDTSESLRAAMHQNPYTKLFVAMGYYDLACPLGTVEQILNEMELDPRLASNVTRRHYPAGHMMYLDETCRIKLHDDLASFIQQSSSPQAPKGSLR
jgi:carboxypeptidase C (cathepsin A)